MIERVIEAIEQSAQVAARYATASLRRTAYQEGWPGRQAASLNVRYQDSSWTVTGSEDAANSEYGTPSTPPNASVRRFATNSRTVEEAFLADLGARLRGVL